MWLQSLAFKLICVGILAGIGYACVKDHFISGYKEDLKKEAVKRDGKRKGEATKYKEKAQERNRKIRNTKSVEERVKTYIDSTR